MSNYQGGLPAANPDRSQDDPTYEGPAYEAGPTDEQLGNLARFDSLSDPEVYL